MRNAEFFLRNIFHKKFSNLQFQRAEILADFFVVAEFSFSSNNHSNFKYIPHITQKKSAFRYLNFGKNSAF